MSSGLESHTNPFQTNVILHKATYSIKSQDGMKSHKKYCISLSEDRFCLRKQCGPDVMPHFAAFHLGLHCLLRYPFRGFRSIKN